MISFAIAAAEEFNNEAKRGASFSQMTNVRRGANCLREQRSKLLGYEASRAQNADVMQIFE